MSAKRTPGRSSEALPGVHVRPLGDPLPAGHTPAPKPVLEVDPALLSVSVVVTSSNATATLTWIRNLPEVGGPVRKLADDEERMLAEAARLRAAALAIEADIKAHRARAAALVAESWSAADIAAARSASR